MIMFSREALQYQLRAAYCPPSIQGINREDYSVTVDFVHGPVLVFV